MSDSPVDGQLSELSDRTGAPELRDLQETCDLSNVVAFDRTKNEILADVRTLIEEIIGQAVDRNDAEISLDTSFSRDLELESIEFVVLSESLQKKYGDGLDFAAWLASKELHEIINLRVGDIVGFIHQWHT